MKWFRRHIKTGSRLALFALALQFVLSFGHFHVHAAQAASSIQALVDVAHVLDSSADAASERQPPASHDDHQPSHEPCVICAVVSMANQIALATPTALPLPEAVELLSLPASAAPARPSVQRASFRARAPPVS